MNHIETSRPAPRPLATLAGEESGAGQPQGSLKPILIEYLHIFKRRKWWIASTICSALIIALVVTLLMRPVYTATTQIEINREQKNITNVVGIESEATGRNLEFYQTQYSLMEARSLAERVAKRLRLETNENFWAAHGIDMSDFSDADARSPRPSRGSSERLRITVDTLLDHVVISPTRGSALVDVSYSSYDPEMSAQIANAWANEFIAQSIARKFDSTAEARSFLERRLAELRQRVEDSERALVDFASSRNIVTIGNNENGAGSTAQIRERTLAADSLSSLNSELVKATADRILMESRTRAIGAVRTNDTLSRLREQRAKDASEYAQLMQQFDPGYPVAMALQRRIDELDQSIAREEQRITREAREDYRAAVERENNLKARVVALSNQVLDQRRDAIQYNIYQREADTNRQLYDALLQRYKEIGVAGVSANNIAVIDRAEPPRLPSSPKLLVNLFIALVLGSIAALVLVFLLEQSQEGVSDPSRIPDQLGLPLLGSVPKVEEGVAIVEEIRDPKSNVSEAYFAIKSSLAFSTSHGIPRSIMVVSSQPAEGKSISSLSLATVLARVGKKVILIDVDMRKPSLHKHIGVKRDHGVSNYLAGEDDYRPLIREVMPNLDFIPAGPSVPSAAELLSSDRMADFVRTLEKHYDHVIVDSAPIIGLADAPLLSRTVEAVVVVIEAGRVPVRGINSALSRLRSAGAPLIGVILTKLDKRDSEYGYGYAYSYEYTSRGAETESASG
ncbi:GumC family protein [Sphingopyxis alaskensis]|jgi:polysaccharide biosynthesis transport protein|uniref:non-specific protein-tyrosine kinase n=1 Tax=Sphingopyxis alaskensis (strain DSM 13593 / LMG 18877 / RB2256) TaxID=317655 RepID=Q1GSS6_SPHAL|nr:polysaccharide biosynthesis tyrosine autokinase [Sphingopyxis alaskensis]ABF53296.1 Protein-tyrosine kinase [Sphingopyxis alaskensis RB2256]MCM3418716.1 polysaccharide biosynthesis tyrosine autokinase [Sphingopyxis alaskensis]